MKFYGSVGFWHGEEEISPGIWKPQIVERPYKGDILRFFNKNQSTEYLNDSITVNNQISILSDLYAQQNWSSIRYVIWNNAKWKVNTIEVRYPRLILEIGGIYNGET